MALDNDYEVWSAFDNHYWPALYFVDRDGIMRDHYFGEGHYEQSERDIQRGVLAGIRIQQVEFTAYVFNPDDSKPLVVLAVSLSLP